MSESGVKRDDIKKSFLWSAVETYAGQIVQFVIGIILARILTPTDYGTVALTTIFICIGNALLSSGFPTALLRKKVCQNIDYETVFTFNVVVAIFMFAIVYLCAPAVALFYNMPDLKWILRAMGLTFVIGSFCTVSSTILKRQLKFRSIALITLSTSVVTGVIAIILAYCGWGVWALVLQAISSSTISSIIIIIIAGWHPRFGFAKAPFKEMFGFGSKILGGNLLTQFYQNMYGIMIGKFFSAASVAYFTRADGYSKLVPINISGVIQRSLLPLLVKIQDDDDDLRRFNKTMVNSVSFLVFPLSLILAGTAYPVISVMLTDKWIATAPLLQILCIGVLPDHIYCINNDFLLVKGRSDLVFKEQLITKVISISLFVATIPFGIEWIAIGKCVSSILTWAYSAFYLKKVLNMSIRQSVSGLTAPLLCSLVIGCGNAIVFRFLDYNLINLLIALFLSAIMYLACAKLMFPQSLNTILNFRK